MMYRKGQMSGQKLKVGLCTKYRTKYILCVKETPLKGNLANERSPCLVHRAEYAFLLHKLTFLHLDPFAFSEGGILLSEQYCGTASGCECA